MVFNDRAEVVEIERLIELAVVADARRVRAILTPRAHHHNRNGRGRGIGA